MLLCAHQQEGQHLSALTMGSNGHQEEPVSDHQGPRGLAKLSLYLAEGFVQLTPPLVLGYHLLYNNLLSTLKLFLF